LAARHLARNGYKVLYRNFRAPRGGEVDLVCRERRSATLVFVEVKTRSSEEHGTPGQAVTLAKQRLITRGALEWLRLLDHPDIRCRFDVVEVLLTHPDQPEIRIIPNAFEIPAPYIY